MLPCAGPCNDTPRCEPGARNDACACIPDSAKPFAGDSLLRSPKVPVASSTPRPGTCMRVCLPDAPNVTATGGCEQIRGFRGRGVSFSSAPRFVTPRASNILGLDRPAEDFEGSPEILERALRSLEEALSSRQAFALRNAILLGRQAEEVARESGGLAAALQEAEAIYAQILLEEQLGMRLTPRTSPSCSARTVQISPRNLPRASPRVLPQASPRPTLELASDAERSAIRELLRTATCRSADACAPGGCPRMSGAHVLECHRIDNGLLWEAYQTAASGMMTRHSLENVDVAKLQLVGRQEELRQKLLIETVEQQNLNEVIAMHGTSNENARLIALRGFDERVSSMDGLYGAGTYLATESCKAAKYTEDASVKTVVIVQVLCGDVFHAKSALVGIRRPPERRHGSGLLYDSIVANPGPMVGARSGYQYHREIIVFNGSQLYPLFIVKYTTNGVLSVQSHTATWDLSCIRPEEDLCMTSARFSLRNIKDIILDISRSGNECSIGLTAPAGSWIDYTMSVDPDHPHRRCEHMFDDFAQRSVTTFDNSADCKVTQVCLEIHSADVIGTSRQRANKRMPP